MFISNQFPAGVLFIGPLLLSGPFLAGLSKAPWGSIPAFAFILAGFLLGCRRLSTPTTRFPQRLLWSVTLATAAAMAMVMAGWATAQQTGAVALPLPVPLVLTALTACCALGCAPAPTGPRGTPPAPAEPPRRPPVEHVLARLRTMPTSHDLQDIDNILRDLQPEDASRVLPHFVEAAGHGDERIDLALLRYTTQPAVRAQLDTRADLAHIAGLGLSSPFARVRAETRNLLRAMLAAGCDARCYPRASVMDDAAIVDPDNFRELADAIAARQRQS